MTPNCPFGTAVFSSTTFESSQGTSTTFTADFHVLSSSFVVTLAVCNLVFIFKPKFLFSSSSCLVKTPFPSRTLSLNRS